MQVTDLMACGMGHSWTDRASMPWRRVVDGSRATLVDTGVRYSTTFGPSEEL